MEKQQTEINLDNVLSPEELTEKYSSEMAEYFGVDVEKGITTVVFDSMEDIAKAFCEYTGKELPSYLKGFSPDGEKSKEIWIVKWDVPDEHGRIMDRAFFNRSLKHEMVHAYQKIFDKKNGTDSKKIPIWLKEGQAILLAGQIYPEFGPISIEELRDLGGFDARKFPIGYQIVSRIVKKYGKERLLEIMSLPGKEEILKELESMPELLK